MTLYLDSASTDDAREAMKLGFIGGITTNPALIAKTAGRPDDVILELCNICPGTVFYQLAGPSLYEREAEAWQLVSMRPNIGLKIPGTLENLGLAARLAKRGFIVGITAIFSAAQVYLACEAGARYVVPYVSRSTRVLGDGLALVREMRTMIDANRAPVEIIAASIKSSVEATSTVLAGAHHLTLPLSVIEAMGAHPLSEQAIQEFAKSSP